MSSVSGVQGVSEVHGGGLGQLALLIQQVYYTTGASLKQVWGGGGGGVRLVVTCICTKFNTHVHVYTVEPPIKDAPNKGHLRIKDTIQSTKKSLSYSASTFLTSE